MMIAKWLKVSALVLGLIVASASTASAAVVQFFAQGTTSNTGPYSYSDLGGGNGSVVLPSGTLTVTYAHPMNNYLQVNDTLAFFGATVISPFQQTVPNFIPGLIAGTNEFLYGSIVAGVGSNGSDLSPLALVALFYGFVSVNGFSDNEALLLFFFDTDGSHTATYDWAMITLGGTPPTTVPEPSSAAIALMLAGSGLFYRWRRNRKA